MAFLLAKPTPHNVNHDNDRFSMFNKKRDIPAFYFSGGIAEITCNVGRTLTFGPVTQVV